MLAGVLKQLRSVTHDAKRGPRPKGLEAWFPYYAGFSEQWAGSALHALRLRRKARVLDPWNGSGTTTHIASALGLEAWGVDINPVAAVVASAKLAHPDDTLHYEGVVAQIVANAQTIEFSIDTRDPLRLWLSKDLVETCRSLLTATLNLLAQRSDGSTPNPLSEPLPPLAAFFVLCLLRALKRVSRMRASSNPTWQRPEYVSRASPRTLITEFRHIAKQFSLELAAYTLRSAKQSIVIGDARQLPFEDGSIDVVLTSPPYCTRLDYVVGAQFELAALGVHNEAYLQNLRRNSMGTPLMRGFEYQLKNFEPKTRGLLQAIGSHKSKNSSSYYLSSYMQYFSDVKLSLAEIARVLRSSGIIVLVLQTSYYKEIPIDLSALYLEIGHALGFRGTRVDRRPVKKILTDINREALRYLSKRSYFEDVIVMEA